MNEYLKIKWLFDASRGRRREMSEQMSIRGHQNPFHAKETFSSIITFLCCLNSRCVLWVMMILWYLEFKLSKSEELNWICRSVWTFSQDQTNQTKAVQMPELFKRETWFSWSRPAGTNRPWVEVLHRSTGEPDMDRMHPCSRSWRRWNSRRSNGTFHLCGPSPSLIVQICLIIINIRLKCTDGNSDQPHHVQTSWGSDAGSSATSCFDPDNQSLCRSEVSRVRSCSVSGGRPTTAEAPYHVTFTHPTQQLTGPVLLGILSYSIIFNLSVFSLSNEPLGPWPLLSLQRVCQWDWGDSWSIPSTTWQCLQLRSMYEPRSMTSMTQTLASVITRLLHTWPADTCQLSQESPELTRLDRTTSSAWQHPLFTVSIWGSGFVQLQQQCTGKWPTRDLLKALPEVGVTDLHDGGFLQTFP